ncbi:MAG: ATP-binding protein [Candidatus Aminicenantes bacterium]|nr:ATP-binding protein [Candidatus Aminicenantes bacterium]
MEIREKKRLEVTVDKRHIVSIGERLYAESVDLLRELVNNAYDADATEVSVEIDPERITVADDGAGMDMACLEQYFTIGSDEKVVHARSPRFGRVRIGQFGIGKFASLAAASRFEVITRHKDFCARVVFDKKAWESAKEEWHLPCEILSPDSRAGDGTTVALSELSKSFQVEDVERRLLESVPLRAPDFTVILNGRRLYPRSLVGRKIPILEGTKHGLVTGEVVITPKSASDFKDLGIDVKVKSVTVKKDLFGMETWGKAVARVKGEIHADFLPVTSDRSGFIIDSGEYQEFLKVMEKIVGVIGKALGKEADRSEQRKSSRAVNEALQRIHSALARNPDLSPFGPVSYGEPGDGGGSAATRAPEPKRNDAGVAVGAGAEGTGTKAPPAKPKRKKRRHPLVKRVTPNAIVRRMRMGTESVSICLDFFGPTGPECFSEANVVYINRDHPLFQRESRKATAQTMYIARLVTQEISLMKETRSPRVAFSRQSQLLKDAFADE